MQTVTSYELHTLEKGEWKTQLVFDDKQEALIEARRIEESIRPRDTRVVEEECDESSGSSRRSRIVYPLCARCGQSDSVRKFYTSDLNTHG